MTPTIPHITAQIEERLRDVREGLSEARAAIKAIEAEEQGLARALRALAPDSALVAPTKPAPPKPKPRRQKKVSEALLDRVRVAIDQAAEPVTLAVIAETADTTKSAAQLAVWQLRDRQMIRRAGVSPGRGKPVLWAPMNGDGDA